MAEQAENAGQEVKEELKDDDEKQLDDKMEKLEVTESEEKASSETNEEIGRIVFSSPCKFYFFSDIDLSDPDVEAAAVKIQSAFSKKKAKK